MDYIILPIGQKKVFLIGHPINCNSCVWPCQISTVAEDSQDSQESVDSVTDSQKRREILSRRPSYRYRSSTGPLSQPQGGRKKSQSGSMTVMLTQCCQIGILFLMQIGCHFGSDWAVNEIWWHIVDWESETLIVIVIPCRKILNDLSSDVSAVPPIEEEKSEDDSTPAITTVAMPTSCPIYQTASGQYST